MFKFIKDAVNDRKYELQYNSRNMNITLTRIKNLKEFKNSLIKLSEIDVDKGYFIYNEPNFASFGLKNPIDIVWVDWDDRIIHYEESFVTNKVSSSYPNTKFTYILKAGTIERKRFINNDVLNHVYDRKKSKNNSIL